MLADKNGVKIDLVNSIIIDASGNVAKIDENGQLHIVGESHLDEGNSTETLD